MTHTSDGTRTPARALSVTFRFDGALLLELLADHYHVMATAECRVEDTDGAAQVLAAWANSPGLEPRPRRSSRPDLVRPHPEGFVGDYSRGWAVSFISDEPRDRSAMGGHHGDELMFGESFGSLVPADPGRAEAFATTLARETRVFFRRAQAKARERLAAGDYLAVLRDQLAQLRGLRSDQTAYRRLEHTIRAIVRDERYLRLAEDESARDLVTAIDAELDFLYGLAMDLERGGVAR